MYINAEQVDRWKERMEKDVEVEREGEKGAVWSISLR